MRTMAPLHVATLTAQRELPKYLASKVSTLPLYQEWNHGSTISLYVATLTIKRELPKYKAFAHNITYLLL